MVRRFPSAPTNWMQRRPFDSLVMLAIAALPLQERDQFGSVVPDRPTNSLGLNLAPLRQREQRPLTDAEKRRRFTWRVGQPLRRVFVRNAARLFTCKFLRNHASPISGDAFGRARSPRMIRRTRSIG